MKRFYRNADIEALAEDRLLEMERAMGKPLTLPIPIDYLGEAVLGLDFLWDTVQELPGELDTFKNPRVELCLHLGFCFERNSVDQRPVDRFGGH